VVGFKVVIRLLVGLIDMTAARKGRVLAGVNKEELEKSAAAGLKLIRKPSQVGDSNFRRLCDLRSREVCLSRAPKDFAGMTAFVNHVGTRQTAPYTVNLCESTLMGQTMSIAIFHRLT
jgi:hypothetical protein